VTDQVVIQFSTTVDSAANWTSAAIRRLTHSPFSHMDLILSGQHAIDLAVPDGSALGASDQGVHSACFKGNPCGVGIRPSEYQPFGLRRRMILETDKATEIIAAAATQLGKPFDSSGLWDFVEDSFPGARDWRSADSWWCSELGIWSLEQGGFFPTLLSWPKNRVSPTDVLLINLQDTRWINRDTFWNPVPGLLLGVNEK
jgi:hypothetical protein